MQACDLNQEALESAIEKLRRMASDQGELLKIQPGGIPWPDGTIRDSIPPDDEGKMIGDTKHQFDVIAGFGLPVPFDASTEIFNRSDARKGPTGYLSQKGDLWYWKIEGAGGTSRERAEEEMKAAIEGALVIEGLDPRGLPVGRRTGKGYGGQHEAQMTLIGVLRGPDPNYCKICGGREDDPRHITK